MLDKTTIAIVESLHTRLKGEVIIVKDRRLFWLGKMGYLLPELPQ